MASKAEGSARSDPNFAIICSFVQEFGGKCGLNFPCTERLQNMLENTGNVDPVLVDLHVRLLRKCRKNVKPETWEKVLIKFCASYSIEDAWDIESSGYTSCKISTKVSALKHLLEAQFDYNNKFKGEVNKITANDLRLKPIGRDKQGCLYWMQLDYECNLRLFKEDPDEETWELVASDLNSLIRAINRLGEEDPRGNFSKIPERIESNIATETEIVKNENHVTTNSGVKDETQECTDKTECSESQVSNDVVTEKNSLLMNQMSISPELLDSEVVGVVISDPPVTVIGNSEGELCESFPSEPFDLVVEPVLFFSGQGRGHLCETGNLEKGKDVSLTPDDIGGANNADPIEPNASEHDNSNPCSAIEPTKENEAASSKVGERYLPTKETTTDLSASEIKIKDEESVQNTLLTNHPLRLTDSGTSTAVLNNVTGITEVLTSETVISNPDNHSEATIKVTPVNSTLHTNSASIITPVNNIEEDNQKFISETTKLQETVLNSEDLDKIEQSEIKEREKEKPYTNPCHLLVGTKSTDVGNSDLLLVDGAKLINTGDTSLPNDKLQSDSLNTSSHERIHDKLASTVNLCDDSEVKDSFDDSKSSLTDPDLAIRKLCSSDSDFNTTSKVEFDSSSRTNVEAELKEGSPSNSLVSLTKKEPCLVPGFSNDDMSVNFLGKHCLRTDVLPEITVMAKTSLASQINEISHCPKLTSEKSNNISENIENARVKPCSNLDEKVEDETEAKLEMSENGEIPLKVPPSKLPDSDLKSRSLLVISPSKSENVVIPLEPDKSYQVSQIKTIVDSTYESNSSLNSECYSLKVCNAEAASIPKKGSSANTEVVSNSKTVSERQIPSLGNICQSLLSKCDPVQSSELQAINLPSMQSDLGMKTEKIKPSSIEECKASLSDENLIENPIPPTPSKLHSEAACSTNVSNAKLDQNESELIESDSHLKGNSDLSCGNSIEGETVHFPFTQNIVKSEILVESLEMSITDTRDSENKQDYSGSSHDIDSSVVKGIKKLKDSDSRSFDSKTEQGRAHNIINSTLPGNELQHTDSLDLNNIHQATTSNSDEDVCPASKKDIKNVDGIENPNDAIDMGLSVTIDDKPVIDIEDTSVNANLPKHIENNGVDEHFKPQSSRRGRRKHSKLRASPRSGRASISNEVASSYNVDGIPVGTTSVNSGLENADITLTHASSDGVVPADELSPEVFKVCDPVIKDQEHSTNELKCKISRNTESGVLQFSKNTSEYGTDSPIIENSQGTEPSVIPEKRRRGRPRLKKTISCDNKTTTQTIDHCDFKPQKRRGRKSIIERLEERLSNPDPVPLRGTRTSSRLQDLYKKQEEERRQQEERQLQILKAQQIKRDRKVFEEPKLESSLDGLKEKKRKKKKKRFKIIEVEDSDDQYPQIEKKKRKKKRKKKAGRPWVDSTESSSDNEEDDDDLEVFGQHEEEEELIFKSDHEFSPESDLDASELEPIKHARTAKTGKSCTVEDEEKLDEKPCMKCSQSDHPDWILLCDQCDTGWHASCLRPPLMVIPEGDWFCPPCEHEQLVDKLTSELQVFETLLKKKEKEEVMKKRLEYINISLSNVIPHKSESCKPIYDSEESDSSGEDSDSTEDSSDSSSPIYPLRQRRATQNVNYIMNQYDEMINSALQDEMEFVAGAGNQGKGKDINTIINAEKAQPPPENDENKINVEEVDKGEKNISSEEDNDEPYSDNPKPINKMLNKAKKKRKLTSLEESNSEDDYDEDFRGSSEEEEEDDYNPVDSESDDFSGRARGRKCAPTRRSNRNRVTRQDIDFINDDDEDDESDWGSKKKKKQSYFSDSGSEESDVTWGSRKKKNQYKTIVKRKGRKRMKKQSIVRGSRENKPKSQPGSRMKRELADLDLIDDAPLPRRTRGVKTSYEDILGSDSDDEKAPTKRRKLSSESEEEFDVKDEMEFLEEAEDIDVQDRQKKATGRRRSKYDEDDETTEEDNDDSEEEDDDDEDDDGLDIIQPSKTVSSVVESDDSSPSENSDSVKVSEIDKSNKAIDKSPLCLNQNIGKSDSPNNSSDDLAPPQSKELEKIADKEIPDGDAIITDQSPCETVKDVAPSDESPINFAVNNACSEKPSLSYDSIHGPPPPLIPTNLIMGEKKPKTYVREKKPNPDSKYPFHCSTPRPFLPSSLLFSPNKDSTKTWQKGNTFMPMRAVAPPIVKSLKNKEAIPTHMLENNPRKIMQPSPESTSHKPYLASFRGPPLDEPLNFSSFPSSNYNVNYIPRSHPSSSGNDCASSVQSQRTKDSEREQESEFGGLVSYFSSQAEEVDS